MAACIHATPSPSREVGCADFCNLDPRIVHRSLLLPTLKRLQKRDQFLLVHNTDERSITHKMGIYAEQTVNDTHNHLCLPKGVDVDCEFPYRPLANLSFTNRTEAVEEIEKVVRGYLSEMANILKTQAHRNIISLLLFFAIQPEVKKLLRDREGWADGNYQVPPKSLYELVQRLSSFCEPDEPNSCNAEQQDILETARLSWRALEETSFEQRKEDRRPLNQVLDVLKAISPQNLKRLGEILYKTKDEIKRRHIRRDETGIILLLPSLDSVWKHKEEEELITAESSSGATKISSAPKRQKYVYHKMNPDIVVHDRIAPGQKEGKSLYYAIEVKKMPQNLSENFMRNPTAGKVITFLSECLYDILKIHILNKRYGHCPNKIGGALVILRTQHNSYPDPSRATQMAATSSYPVACFDYPC